MKIPVLDSPSVRPQALPTPYSNLNQDTGGADVAKGLAQLGAGIGGAVDQVQAAKERFNAVAVNDALTAYQLAQITALDGNGDKPGFLSTRGYEAGAKRADVLKGLEETGGKLEEALKNDEQRQLFRKHAQKMYLGTRARVEGHVQGQNREAEVSSLSARISTSLDAIAKNYTDVDGTATQTLEDTVQVVRAFAAPMGDADAKVAAVRQKATSLRMDGYLAARDYQGAEKLFAEAQKTGALGAKADDYNKVIQTLKADVQAQGAVDAAVETARNPASGKVSEAAAEKAVQELPTGPVRDEAEKRLTHALSREAKVWKQTVDTHYTRAMGAYLDSGDLGAIDSKDKAWLLTHAVDEWRAILHEAYGDDARARARASAARGRGAGETDEQRQALIEFKADVMAHPEKYKGMTPEGFFSEWRTKLSANGYSRAGDLFARTQKEGKAQTGRTEFRAFVENELKGTPSLQGKDKRKANAFTALMGDEFNAFQDAHPGRAPTTDELRKMRDSVWTTRDTWFGLGTPEKVLKPRGAAPTGTASPAVTPPVNAAPPGKSKLAPGRYRTKDGKVVVVDAQGNKKLEL